MIYILIFSSLVGIVIANRWVLELKDIRIIAKTTLIRSCIKFLVGITAGFVLAIVMTALQVQSSIAILGLFLATLGTGILVSITLYRMILKKYCGLDFKLSELFKSYIVELLVMIALTTILLFIYGLNTYLQ